MQLLHNVVCVSKRAFRHLYGQRNSSRVKKKYRFLYKKNRVKNPLNTHHYQLVLSPVYHQPTYLFGNFPRRITYIMLKNAISVQFGNSKNHYTENLKVQSKTLVGINFEVLQKLCICSIRKFEMLKHWSSSFV